MLPFPVKYTKRFFWTLWLILFTIFFIIALRRNANQNLVADEIFLYSGRDQQNNAQNSTRICLILLWTTFYDVWSGHPLSRPCPTNNKCRLTNDRRLLSTSDAVVFHCRDINLIDMPKTRQPHQRWVFFCLEPPTYSYFLGFRFMKGMFNWTMTYRRDSDIRVKYGMYQKRNATIDKSDLAKLWPSKTKSIYWMVSHCDTFSNREGYVTELSQYIDIDVYGKCGLSSCPRNQTLKCQKDFSTKYKFVLAFENSLCQDYVSEKFFEALAQPIVPIVFGTADYADLAPPESYIDALSFKGGPKELADHLNSVASSQNRYNSYLKWKKQYKVNYRKISEHYVCELCNKLQATDREAVSVHEDLTKWWVQESYCYTWTL